MARVLFRWVWRQLYDTEVDAAVGYDNAVRRFMPHDAETFCNFPPGAAPAHYHDMGGARPGMPPPHLAAHRGPPVMMPDGSRPGAWDADDMHVRRARLSLQCVSRVESLHMLRTYLGTCSASLVPVVQSSVHSSAMSTQQRGMVKSSSVSTLMAAATLAESSALAHSHSDHFGAWHPGGHGMPMHAAIPGHAHDVSAASLLLGTEPLSARSLHQQQGSIDGSAGAEAAEAPPAAALDAAPSSRSAASQHGRGSDSGRAPRRINSAHDLASSAQGGVTKTVAGKGATRASIRRAQSRYAKDKSRPDEAEKAAEAARASAGAAAAARPVDGKSSEEQKLEVRLSAAHLLPALHSSSIASAIAMLAHCIARGCWPQCNRRRVVVVPFRSASRF